MRRCQRVFLAAQLLGDAAGPRAASPSWLDAATLRSARDLSVDSGYTELGELDAERAEHVGCRIPARLRVGVPLFRRRSGHPAGRNLSAPVTVVVAADDPDHGGVRASARRLELLAEHVELHELADGGHYFLRTRPAEAAQAVLRSSRNVDFS